MSEFCEGCPSAGDCVGDIVGLKVVSSITHGSVSRDGRSASFSFEMGIPQGPTDMVVQYTDASAGASAPFEISGKSAYDAESQARKFVGKVERCPGPTEIKKLFGLITKRACSAAHS